MSNQRDNKYVIIWGKWRRKKKDEIFFLQKYYLLNAQEVYIQKYKLKPVLLYISLQVKKQRNINNWTSMDNMDQIKGNY